MAKQKISQEEVWDDSALVQSWNEALQEYKKYHSLAAKGEKVALVLDEAESGVPEKAPNTKVESKEEPELKAPNVNLEAEQQDAVGGAEAPQQQPQAEATVVGAGTMPQVLMNSVQDEGLKNMMMSWYYAGYYTGLYEGQQKAYSSMQQ